MPGFLDSGMSMPLVAVLIVVLPSSILGLYKIYTERFFFVLERYWPSLVCVQCILLVVERKSSPPISRFLICSSESTIDAINLCLLLMVGVQFLVISLQQTTLMSCSGSKICRYGLRLLRNFEALRNTLSGEKNAEQRNT